MKELIEKYGILVSSRLFTINDQRKFSEFSGDFNPIHIDKILARKTIVGERIVHGIHGLMWSLNEFFKNDTLVVNFFNAKFHKPITLDSPVFLFWNSQKKKLTIANESTLFTTITINFGNIENNNKKFDIKLGYKLTEPKNLSIKECDELGNQEIIYRGNVNVGQLLFPELFKIYGSGVIAEIALTSEIVGMQMPGLHSLFISIVGSIFDSSEDSIFRLEDYDLRFGVLKIKMQGKHLKSQIEALNVASSTAVPSVKHLKKFINLNEFKYVDALVIGGSRGLGELTAKLISCGGGRVTISYNLGEADAKNVQKEILASGLSCAVTQLDITSSFIFPLGNFNQIYYFPTPKIKIERNVYFDYQLTELYKKYYVDGFKSLVSEVLNRKILASIFYPSTNLIDYPSKNFSSYIKAKAEGENLCQQFNKLKNMRIFFPRLPRVATDQTLSVTPMHFHDAIEVMLPHIRNISHDLYI